MADEKEQTAQPSMDHFFKKQASKPTEPYKQNHPKQKKFRKTLVAWIVDSNRPFVAVEDKQLMEAFHLADPKLKMPSAFMVRCDIVKLENDKKHEIKEAFKSVDYFSCTNDAGSSLDGRSFVDVNVHWVSKQFIPQKKILTVVEMEQSKTAENYRKAVDDCLREFQIQDKVISFR